MSSIILTDPSVNGVLTPPSRPFEIEFRSGPITIAIDTEFCGVDTLTIQAAARVDERTIAVQVLRSPTIPDLPSDLDLTQYLPVDASRYGRFFDRVILRPTRPIAPDLSPARIARDLLGLPVVSVPPLYVGRAIVAAIDRENPDRPPNLRWNRRRRQWDVPALKLVVVGHFLTADFFRAWGRDALRSLIDRPRFDRVRIGVSTRKILGFRQHDCHKAQSDPCLEFARLDDGRLLAVHVAHRDTMFPFGPASLDTHSQTFLGVPKSTAITADDKKDMRRAFREKTRDAYGYAIVDAVNTLLVHEQMQVRDRRIYQSFGIPDDDVPPLRPTLGSRVSDFIVRTAAQTVATDSIRLSSLRRVKELMSAGGPGLLERRPEASRYGRQTTEVQGGLLFSRSPTRVWHEAPGMLRDVDMSGCYQKVTSKINKYFGMPVIFEPGRRPLSLREAVALATRNADQDGWLIRATGEIAAAPNALIPSTIGAVTSQNYHAERRKRSRRISRRGFALDRFPEPTSEKGTGKSRLYSAVIESGIVTHATWTMIQSLPTELRRQYEALAADAVVLYPRTLVADDGPSYDDLMARLTDDAPPWDSMLDLENRRLVSSQVIDASYVALKYPIGRYAEEIGRLRREAQRVEGKKSGADLAWKVHANTMYGVLASPHLATANFVAANVITAHARAEAFAIVMALNGVQVITDGCPYRLDQIPACRFAECLWIQPDYTIRRAEADSGIPFLDPATIPVEDAAFTLWYRSHVMRFFDASGPEFEELIATHGLEHKKTGESDSASFDALGVDGCANYVKATQDGTGWKVEELKARSYKKESKHVLQDWIVPTYSTDRLVELAPVTEDVILLKYKQAGQLARKALESGVPEVVYPLGFEFRRVGNYKTIKISAFVFQNPEQRDAIEKQLKKFEDRTGCGLEALALRRSYGGRRHGSLVDLVDEIYRTIRGGGDDLTRALNLNRTPDWLARISRARAAEIAERKAAALAALFDAIDVRNASPEALAVGLVVSLADEIVVR